MYALFLWICNQDFSAIQKADFPDDIDEDTPMGYFREILYRTKSFTDLFTRLMKFVVLFLNTTFCIECYEK